MNYYPELLAAVLRRYTNEAAPRSIALSGAVGDAAPDNPDGFVAAPLLANVLPAYLTLETIAGLSTFPRLAQDAATRTNARCVFAFPPLLGRQAYSAHWREQYGPLECAEVLAQVLLDGPSPIAGDDRRRPNTPELPFEASAGAATAEPAPPAEVVVLLVPRTLILSSRLGEWRRQFFPAHSATIIEHDHPGVAEALGADFHPSLRFATLVFERNPGPVRFFKVNADSLVEGAAGIVKDLSQLLRQPRGRTRYGFVIERDLDPRYPSSFDFYSEETEKLRQEISVLGQKVPLSSVADIFMGGGPPLRRGEHEGEIRVLTLSGRDVTIDGRVDLSDVQEQQRPTIVRSYLQDGDFCVRLITSNRGNLVVGVYEGDGRSIAAGSSIIVVRPHAVLTPPQRRVLLAYLRSPIGYRLANAKSTVSMLGDAIRISIDLLRDFPVPIADADLSSSVEQLTQAKERFRSWIDDIDRESNAIIEEATASGSRTRLLSAGRLARQRQRAGEQVQQLDYRIRTQFPHPLAYVWRKLQVAGSDRYHRLDAALKAAESHTCFLALVALLSARSIGQSLKWSGEIGKRLSSRKSGTNFGDWLSILKEFGEAKIFRTARATLPVVEGAEISGNVRWLEAVSRLKSWRDDAAHGRIAASHVPEDLLQAAEKALEVAFKESEFLTDYRLIYITETRFDSIRRKTRFRYQDLTGDNSLAQRCDDQSDRTDLEALSLYLRDRNGALFLFRPLLHYLECPECHLMSTFFLDTFEVGSGDHIVGLKSFETNSVRREALADDFRHVGLLPSTALP